MLSVKKNCCVLILFDIEIRSTYLVLLWVNCDCYYDRYFPWFSHETSGFHDSLWTTKNICSIRTWNKNENKTRRLVLNDIPGGLKLALGSSEQLWHWWILPGNEYPTFHVSMYSLMEIENGLTVSRLPTHLKY